MASCGKFWCCLVKVSVCVCARVRWLVEFKRGSNDDKTLEKMWLGVRCFFCTKEYIYVHKCVYTVQYVAVGLRIPSGM